MWCNELCFVDFGLTHIGNSVGEYFEVVVYIDRLYFLCYVGHHDCLH